MVAKIITERKHYWLTVGTISVRKDDQQVDIRINGMLPTEQQAIHNGDMVRMHQNLATLACRSVDVPPTEILGVLLENITYLGHMTEVEMFGEESVAAQVKGEDPEQA